ncbi:MAG: PAS domain-containing protein, partial [Chloroflexota bacterium]
THTVLEILRYSGYTIFVGPPDAQVILLSFIPVSLFFVPVVYAALNFGLAGAVATAAWCTLLTIPNIMLHSETERVREVLQLGIVDGIAVFVGQRVDREMSAREEAEDASAALRVSEAQYRGRFESSPAPILVLDPQGVVLEANPAAGVLLSRSSGALKGARVSDLFELAGAERILGLLQEGRRED